MAKINQKTIDAKKKFINDVIEKIKKGTAAQYEIDKACDTIYWMYQWKVIDREESGRLADAISDAMEGIE